MLEYIPKRRRVSGVRLDPRKADSTRLPIAAAFVPERLFVPVEAHRGALPAIIVQPGQPVLRGQTIAAGPPGSGVVNVHASSSGIVRELGTCEVQAPNGPRALQCIVIDTDGRDTACEEPQARVDPIERIRSAGVVGLGGAAVSTSWKLTRREAVSTVIINGAECEPYISCDDMLMRERAPDILAGSLALADLLGAQSCIVAIERDKPLAIGAIRKAAEDLADPRLSLAELPGIYPAGGERQLIELLIDAEVPTGGYPTDIGILCQNVATACAVNDALAHNRPLISRVVTLTGRGIASPRNVYARIGTRIGDLIEHFGGYTDDPAALIVGGSMMGSAQLSDAVPISRSTNCILVPGRDELDTPQREWPCIRCAECAAACPARLLPQELLAAARKEDTTMLETLGLNDCIECGCCDAVCPSHISLTQTFIEAGRLLARRHETQVFANASQNRFDLHTQRLESREDLEQAHQSALRARLSTEDAKKDAIAAALERARRRRDSGDAQ